MDTIEIHMVTFASPAARRVDGKLKEIGQIRIQQDAWSNSIFLADSEVSGDKWYACRINGSAR